MSPLISKGIQFHKEKTATFLEFPFCRWAIIYHTIRKIYIHKIENLSTDFFVSRILRFRAKPIYKKQTFVNNIT